MLETLNTLFQFGILSPLGVIAIILLLILIHELGHFAAGRYFGVGVEEFSIGFGPVFLSRKDRQGTLWTLRILPLGGFVKFVGDSDATSRPGPVGKTPERPVEARKKTLAHIPIWKRAIVVAAGPLANLILAFLLFTLQVSFVGRDVVEPVIAYVSPESAAAATGVEPQDRILRFSGNEIDSFLALNLQLEANLGRTKPLLIERRGKVIELSLTPVSGNGQTTSAQASGLWPQSILEVLGVEPGSPAQAMGLLPGDMIYGYNNQLLFRWQDFAQARADNIDKVMTLHIRRGDEVLALSGIPQRRLITTDEGGVREDGIFGFQVTPYVDRERLGLGAAMGAALHEMRQFSLLIFNLPAQFIRQQRSIDDLGGPVRIAEEVGRVVIFAPAVLLFMAGLLSLQLGIINLLPIPVLDGGHLFLYAVEAVIRRPLPPVLVTWLYRIGGLILIGFFVFVTISDLARLME